MEWCHLGRGVRSLASRSHSHHSDWNPQSNSVCVFIGQSFFVILGLVILLWMFHHLFSSAPWSHWPSSISHHWPIKTLPLAALKSFAMVGLAVDLSSAQQSVLIELYRATLVCQATVCTYRLCCRFLSRLYRRRIKNAATNASSSSLLIDMVWNFRQTYASYVERWKVIRQTHCTAIRQCPIVDRRL